jgi:hypothetical protein
MHQPHQLMQQPYPHMQQPYPHMHQPYPHMQQPYPPSLPMKQENNKSNERRYLALMAFLGTE